MTRTPSWDEASYSSRAGLSGAEGEAIHRLPATASAIEVAEALGLEPHREGGFFRETYRSPLAVHTREGTRPLATAIIYLLTAGSPSRFHRLRFEEIWFFHAGCRAEMVMLESDARRRRSRTQLLGADRPQVLVPTGTWLGVRVAPLQAAGEAVKVDTEADGAAEDDPVGSGRHWTLVGCVVTPGFEYEDFELGSRDVLLVAFPEHAEIVTAFT